VERETIDTALIFDSQTTSAPSTLSQNFPITLPEPATIEEYTHQQLQPPSNYSEDDYSSESCEEDDDKEDGDYCYKYYNKYYNKYYLNKNNFIREDGISVKNEDHSSLPPLSPSSTIPTVKDEDEENMHTSSEDQNCAFAISAPITKRKYVRKTAYLHVKKVVTKRKKRTPPVIGAKTRGNGKKILNDYNILNNLTVEQIGLFATLTFGEFRKFLKDKGVQRNSLLYKEYATHRRRYLSRDASKEYRKSHKESVADAAKKRTKKYKKEMGQVWQPRRDNRNSRK